jgi:zinc transport system ATP-binding protein
VSGVDLEHQEAFAETLGALNRNGHTVLLVAHSLGAMAPLVSRAVQLELGRVVYDGAPRKDQIHTEHIHHHPQLEVVREAARRPGAGS